MDDTIFTDIFTRVIVTTNYARLVTRALIASAGFRPRGWNPRRHPNVPRVKKKYRIIVLLVCENFLDLMKLGAHGGLG